MRNLEIKAKVGNVQLLIDNIAKLTKQEAVKMHQCDTFYNVSKGRLKLRQFEDNTADLIWYDRNDSEAPTLSSYDKCAFGEDEARKIKTLLSHALGEKAIVQKSRLLYTIGQTRVHVDAVENLGDFMELEVVLNEGQTIDDAKPIIKDLMQKLGISQDDLLATAYVDMLSQ